jgi:hypothetical protein
MSDLANTTEFKTVARREFSRLDKAQVVGQLLHAQGFGVRLWFNESVTQDAFGNDIKREASRYSLVKLSTNASYDDLQAAVKDYDKAAAEVTVEAVKAKLAQ